MLFERGQHLPGAPVQLFNRVAVQAGPGFPAKLPGGVEGDVRKGVREEQHERRGRILGDESHGPVGIPAGKGALVDRLFDQDVAVVECEIRHVVACRGAEEPVEAMFEREMFGEIAQMPLAQVERPVALPLHQFAERFLRFREAVGRFGVDHLEGQARADRVAARHQPGPRRGADVCAGVALREPQSGRRQAVDMRRPDPPGAVRADVAVAEIVGEDYDDIRWRSGGGGTGARRLRGVRIVIARWGRIRTRAARRQQQNRRNSGQAGACVASRQESA